MKKNDAIKRKERVLLKERRREKGSIKGEEVAEGKETVMGEGWGNKKLGEGEEPNNKKFVRKYLDWSVSYDIKKYCPYLGKKWQNLLKFSA